MHYNFLIHSIPAPSPRPTPQSFPKRTPSQIVLDTSKFNNKAYWFTNGSQPFYLFRGNNTDDGQHGGYVIGWKDNSLQKAMDDAKGCIGANCGSLETQQPSDENECTVKNRVNGEYDGWMTELLGMEGMPMSKTV
jgi:hypothetical protein